jgi:hypothetical protein
MTVMMVMPLIVMRIVVETGFGHDHSLMRRSSDCTLQSARNRLGLAIARASPDIETDGVSS